MARIWIRVIRHHRIVQQTTVPCTWETAQSEFNDALHALDIARPLWLNKHDHEFESFRRTTFLPEHFMEDVPFQKLEIEYLEDDGKTRRSNDPRNYFDGV